MCFKILFRSSQPIPCKKITKAIDEFGASYTRTVHRIIQTTEGQSIDKKLFIDNAAKLLKNFKMTRQGPFKGLGFDPNGRLLGPVEKLDACWDSIGDELLALKSLLNTWGIIPRARTIALMGDQRLDIVTKIIWSVFKKLLPITMGKYSYGLVGASKILFAVFPEIVLPVDNAEWRQLFKTVDLGDVIKLMAREILAWETISVQRLDGCDKEGVPTTLPAIYNVMAMKARQ